MISNNHHYTKYTLIIVRQNTATKTPPNMHIRNHKANTHDPRKINTNRELFRFASATKTFPQHPDQTTNHLVDTEKKKSCNKTAIPTKKRFRITCIVSLLRIFLGDWQKREEKGWVGRLSGPYRKGERLLVLVESKVCSFSIDASRDKC